jgi:hypothetical protein
VERALLLLAVPRDRCCQLVLLPPLVAAVQNLPLHQVVCVCHQVLPCCHAAA